ncbi:MAG: stage III sporulation protein AA [Firmicutes bacterium]|nr:stage III sporulation protein AA [Bacillota bacterium]
MTTGTIALPQSLLRLLPDEITDVLARLPADICAGLTEIRLRVERPLELVGVTGYLRPTVRPEHVRHVIATVTGSSLHAVEADVRAGFLTAPGGHRIGLAGRMVLDAEGRVKTMRDIASLNIRMATAATDCAKKLSPYLVDEHGRLRSSVFVGPPLSGKTTLLRDACRLLASGQFHQRLAAMRVVIVDERSEIAACVHGIPQFDVGASTDVLDGCPKAEGMMMALRALAPQVLVTDELGSEAEADAVVAAAHTGVSFLGTLHGAPSASSGSRPLLARLLQAGAVTRVIFLDPKNGPGHIGRVLDGAGREVARGWV